MIILQYKYQCGIDIFFFKKILLLFSYSRLYFSSIALPCPAHPLPHIQFSPLCPWYKIYIFSPFQSSGHYEFHEVWPLFWFARILRVGTDEMSNDTCCQLTTSIVMTIYNVVVSFVFCIIRIFMFTYERNPNWLNLSKNKDAVVWPIPEWKVGIWS